MKRLSTGLAMAVIVMAIACNDARKESALPTAPPRAPSANLAHAPANCPTPAQLNALINNAFGSQLQRALPVYLTVADIEFDVAFSNTADAQKDAYNIVSYILQQYVKGGLPGTASDITALTNGIFCYTGITLTITDPLNTSVVLPGQSQVVTNGAGIAGVSLPPTAVTEPTLLTITPITGSFTTRGSGPLNTKLDQYPGAFTIVKSSQNGSPLNGPVVVAVCPTVQIPLSVGATLRLGHQATGGFEITPPADGSFLHCPTPTGATAVPEWIRRLASMVLPRRLYAQTAFFAGGVGGVATEFSPFDAVDIATQLAGGVGGTAGEFSVTHGRPTVGTLNGSTLSAANAGVSMDVLTSSSCPTTETPIGTPVDQVCRPAVKLVTRLGTLLQNVPVSFAIGSGGGTDAPENSGVCGTFGSTALTATGTNGKAGACWTMGLTPGANTIVATPSVGGDIPPGATINPPNITFTRTATPPTALSFQQQPASGANIVAGTPFTPIVAAVDHNGIVVQGYTSNITVALNKNTFSNATTSSVSPAVLGVATFPNLVITKAATGYQLNASALFQTTPLAGAGNIFNVVAGPPFGLSIVKGNNQVGISGQPAPINPTVLATDTYLNPVNGASIKWTPGGATNSSVNPATSLTGADGTTYTVWTLGHNYNELLSTLSRTALGLPDSSVMFDAKGITPDHDYDDCEPDRYWDPINDPNHNYAFWIPNPGPGKSIKQLELFFASNGLGGTPKPYGIKLSTQVGSFDPNIAPPQWYTGNVFLSGASGENKSLTFVLTTPINGSNSRPPIMIQLQVGSDPDGALINFNTGSCTPGSNCRPPSGCEASETNNFKPYPSGSLYRKTVGIHVRGN
jgi:hypothetical protein